MGKKFRYNLFSLLFVFLAFAMMAGAAYYFVGRVIRQSLLDRAQEMIYTAEANVRAGLSEAETILLNTYHIVQNMIIQNASKQEILDYLTNTTEWMRQKDQGLLNYYGIYGYIHGDFYDSIGLTPDPDHLPQTRPWYQIAVRSGSRVGYTAPYTDWRTGDTIFSAVTNIFDNENRHIGILIIDVEIGWLTEYVSSFTVESGGFGILINQNMTIIAHPDISCAGLQLQELGSSYEEIARILRSGGEALAVKIVNSAGISSVAFFTRIFNGWYIGIVTPSYQFYKDLYLSAIILIILGLILALSLSSMLLSLSDARNRADKESKFKSSFLASMSHEIRTPVNAITGMAELLLRADLSQEARSYALDIKQAGNNLVSIINNVLDISKIEAGKLEIIPVIYSFTKMVNEAVNIIGTRLAEKQVQFFYYIDSKIPKQLIGDEVKVRQILLNLLSNAVKYTDSGYINLSVNIDKKTDDQIWLKISVGDTGKGIKPEDREKLFGDYIQVDSKKNFGIEGTGLGLSITKKLCAAMDGDIGFESEYGKGSTFTAVIPQGIDKNSLSDADDAQETKEETLKSENRGNVKYIYPDARFLIVDDSPVNLRVAQGLLLPYRAKIDVSLSGAGAVELVKKNIYDLVFMDHLMPGMDGMEAVKRIREWEHEEGVEQELLDHLPIVALTANAVAGMREMYLENGFNDYL
ncbi:MAG: ATP-binding protein, partial [Treponema sp.]|nr:ATP-binding protein [Treponema sp.]